MYPKIFRTKIVHISGTFFKRISKNLKIFVLTMFPYTVEYNESEYDIQNISLLYKIHQMCQNTFEHFDLLGNVSNTKTKNVKLYVVIWIKSIVHILEIVSFPFFIFVYFLFLHILYIHVPWYCHMCYQNEFACFALPQTSVALGVLAALLDD